MNTILCWALVSAYIITAYCTIVFKREARANDERVIRDINNEQDAMEAHLRRLFP